MKITLKCLALFLGSLFAGFLCAELMRVHREEQQQRQAIVLPNEVVLTGEVTTCPTNWDGKIDCAIYVGIKLPGGFVEDYPVLIVGSDGFDKYGPTKLDLRSGQYVWNLINNEVTVHGIRDGFMIVAKCVKETP